MPRGRVRFCFQSVVVVSQFETSTRTRERRRRRSSEAELARMVCWSVEPELKNSETMEKFQDQNYIYPINTKYEENYSAEE